MIMENRAATLSRPFLLKGRCRMTAEEKRTAVVAKYSSILGRNFYSQTRRDYCFKQHRDGNYYSDCSSSICYCYKEAGFSFGILNTVGLYQSKKLEEVPVTIKNGQIQNPEILRIGDILLFAGADSSRAYAKFVGHAEMVYEINDSGIILCGHGSGRPRIKRMTTYCKSRYNAKTDTELGNKGPIKVVRFIRDNETEEPLAVPPKLPAPVEYRTPCDEDEVPLISMRGYALNLADAAVMMKKAQNALDEARQKSFLLYK